MSSLCTFQWHKRSEKNSNIAPKNYHCNITRENDHHHNNNSPQLSMENSSKRENPNLESRLAGVGDLE